MLPITLVYVFILIAVYLGVVTLLYKKKILERYNISLYGPFLMIKTDRGKKLIHRLSSFRRFWSWFGDVGVIVCFSSMVAVVLLLLWQFWWLGSHITKDIVERLPEVNMVLVIPGINPLLPIGYTIIAIIIAIVLHEFSHGISASSSGVDIKSLGILAFIIPVGAFVEPDEEQLDKIERRKRMRVFASGPAMNLFISIISLLIFSTALMGSVDVAADGIGVAYMVKDSPAQLIGLDFGSIIMEINGTPIKDIDDFLDVMNRTHAGQNVSITFYKNGEIIKGEVTLADRFAFTNISDDRGKGFLGIVATTGYKNTLAVLKNPFKDFPWGILYLYAMPLSPIRGGYNPITDPYIRFFRVDGLFAGCPVVFWSLTNLVFWMFWLNFAIAIFNALPMIPLDGGYLMQDLLGGLLERFPVGKKSREKITRYTMTALSLLILFLVIYPLLLKYLFPLLHRA